MYEDRRPAAAAAACCRQPASANAPPWMSMLEERSFIGWMAREITRSFLQTDFNILAEWKILDVGVPTCFVARNRDYMVRKQNLQTVHGSTSDVFCFSAHTSPAHFHQVCAQGLDTCLNTDLGLGRTMEGVNLFLHADVMMRAIRQTPYDVISLVLHKAMLGRFHRLSQSEISYCQDPSRDHDSVVCRDRPLVSDSLNVQLLKSQIFFYERYDVTATSGFGKRPRQICPLAYINFVRRRPEIDLFPVYRASERPAMTSSVAPPTRGDTSDLRPTSDVTGQFRSPPRISTSGQSVVDTPRRGPIKLSRPEVVEVGSPPSLMLVNFVDRHIRQTAYVLDQTSDAVDSMFQAVGQTDPTSPEYSCIRSIFDVNSEFEAVRLAFDEYLLLMATSGTRLRTLSPNFVRESCRTVGACSRTMRQIFCEFQRDISTLERFKPGQDLRIIVDRSAVGLLNSLTIIRQTLNLFSQALDGRRRPPALLGQSTSSDPGYYRPWSTVVIHPSPGVDGVLDAAQSSFTRDVDELCGTVDAVDSTVCDAEVPVDLSPDRRRSNTSMLNDVSTTTARESCGTTLQVPKLDDDDNMDTLDVCLQLISAAVRSRSCPEAVRDDETEVVPSHVAALKFDCGMFVPFTSLSSPPITELRQTDSASSGYCTTTSPSGCADPVQLPVADCLGEIPSLSTASLPADDVTPEMTSSRLCRINSVYSLDFGRSDAAIDDSVLRQSRDRPEPEVVWRSLSNVGNVDVTTTSSSVITSSTSVSGSVPEVTPQNSMPAAATSITSRVGLLPKLFPRVRRRQNPDGVRKVTTAAKPSKIPVPQRRLKKRQSTTKSPSTESTSLYHYKISKKLVIIPPPVMPRRKPGRQPKQRRNATALMPTVPLRSHGKLTARHRVLADFFSTALSTSATSGSAANVESVPVAAVDNSEAVKTVIKRRGRCRKQRDSDTVASRVDTKCRNSTNSSSNFDSNNNHVPSRQGLPVVAVGLKTSEDRQRRLRVGLPCKTTCCWSRDMFGATSRDDGQKPETVVRPADPRDNDPTLLPSDNSPTAAVHGQSPLHGCTPVVKKVLHWATSPDDDDDDDPGRLVIDMDSHAALEPEPEVPPSTRPQVPVYSDISDVDDDDDVTGSLTNRVARSTPDNISGSSRKTPAVTGEYYIDQSHTDGSTNRLTIKRRLSAAVTGNKLCHPDFLNKRRCTH